MTVYNYEKIWCNIDDISSEHISEFLKKEIYFMRNSGICHFIAEIDFITNKSVDNEVVIKMPALELKIATCENTILATKNDDTDTIVRIRLHPGKLVINAYPFESSTKYELNIQLFVRMLDSKYYLT